MIREYEHAREHLDDIIALVEKRLERRARAHPAAGDDAAMRALAELDVEIVRRDELVAARVAASLALRDTALRDTALRDTADRLPLVEACGRLGLSATESRVLALLCALEVSAATRRFLEHRAANATVELVEALAYDAHTRAEAAIELAPDGPLFRHRLAIQGDRDLPWLARSLRVAPRVLELAMGRVRLDPELAGSATLIAQPARGDHLLVEPRTRGLVEEALAQQRIPFVVGPRGAGKTSLVLAAAHALGVPALVVRAAALPRDPAALAVAIESLAREAVIFGAALVIRDLHALAADGERAPELVPVVAGALAAHRGPIGITAERAVWPAGAARSVIVAELHVPPEVARLALWQSVIGDGELAVRAAERFRVTGGIIEAAARTARERARARDSDGAVTLTDVRAGVRGELDGELATLGKLVDWQQTWDDLVLPDDIMAELQEMMTRIRHRRRVLDEWGFHRKVGKGVGVSALFSGPPGTGKTMVAGLIAAELELDLYQIDVSRMVSKWVGETEKNLARLFDAASSGHAVLLFDEADSLFAKRTDVKSSNDRYANLEVNYLLQRMESFDGITILTTNLETSVDEAFRRRLAFRIQFQVPELAERVKLWRAMLPAQAQVAPNLDFRALAQRYEMTGGYIRNAVLRAAYLAAGDNQPIGMQHLQRAAMLEYAAMGMVIHSGL